MFRNVEDLVKEIEFFQDNMNRSNGVVALLGESIEKLDENFKKIESISEEINELPLYIKNELDLLSKEQDNLQEQQKKAQESLDLLSKKQDNLQEQQKKAQESVDKLKNLTVLLMLLSILNIFFTFIR